MQAGSNPAFNDAELRAGVLAGLGAYALWGIFPVYFKIVGSADPFEVLVHRVIWAVPFGALIIAARRQWSEVWRALRSPKMVGWLGLAALSISVNWLIYIWAVQQERIFEASLGYYINPLIYVLAGMVLLGERLSRLQVTAVAFAAIGVSILTVSLGEFPWVAISLAVLFTAYGVIRKQVPIGAMPGLFVETVLLCGPALALMYWLAASQQLIFGGEASMTVLLVLAGPITVIPLLLFAVAARRLTLTTIGFMQFLGPTLQFLTGLYYGETLTGAHVACFGFVWAAVIVFSVDAYRKNRVAAEEPL
jgi:chloramphenicol-sensitive protein RarD